VGNFLQKVFRTLLNYFNNKIQKSEVFSKINL
jgi:hypothetical protein